MKLRDYEQTLTDPLPRTTPFLSHKRKADLTRDEKKRLWGKQMERSRRQAANRGDH